MDYCIPTLDRIVSILTFADQNCGMGMKFCGETLRNFRICSRHFTIESYRATDKKQLRSDAVPTLFPMSEPVVTRSVSRADTIRDTGDGKIGEIVTAVVTGNGSCL